jgi:hypothetical protein
LQPARGLFPSIGALLDSALPLRLTLVVLVLRPPGEGPIRAATWLVAGAALVFPQLVTSARTWLVITLLVGARIASDWPLADNHIYLLAYWCLGVSLTLWYGPLRPSCDDPEGSYSMLRSTSRWLVGCAFACAITWKVVLAPDYLDGRFFRVTLSTDDRFVALAAAAGLSDAQLAANRAALEPIPAGLEVLNGPVFTEPVALKRVAGALTWGGLMLELFVAALFLAPLACRWEIVRHAALLIFCAVTYAIAPVAGFGWLLVVLGLSQVRENQPLLRGAYLSAFILILVYAETSAMPAFLGTLERMAAR